MNSASGKLFISLNHLASSCRRQMGSVCETVWVIIPGVFHCFYLHCLPSFVCFCFCESICPLGFRCRAAKKCLCAVVFVLVLRGKEK